MRINKVGSGFVSFHLLGLRFLVLAIHRKWRFAFVRPAMKAHVWRLYVGPLEIEQSNFLAPVRAMVQQ